MGSLLVGILRNPIFRTLLKSFGAATVAAIGWKLGSDVYDMIKEGYGERTGSDEPTES